MAFTSNGKSLYGYLDGTIVARPGLATNWAIGVYARVEGAAGAEKLYAIKCTSSGEHYFVSQSELRDQWGYDVRFASLFEQSPSSALGTIDTANYNRITNLTLNEMPSFESLPLGHQRYATASGWLIQNNGSVSSQYLPLAKDGKVPQQQLSEGGTTTQPGTTQPKGWAALANWQKAMVVVAVISLIILILSIIKVKK